MTRPDDWAEISRALGGPLNFLRHAQGLADIQGALAMPGLQRQARLVKEALGDTRQIGEVLGGLSKQAALIGQLQTIVGKDAATLQNVGLTAWKEAAQALEPTVRWDEVGANMLSAGFTEATRALAGLEVSNFSAAAEAVRNIVGETVTASSMFSREIHGIFTINAAIAEAEPVEAVVASPQGATGWSGLPPVTVHISLDNPLNLLAFLLGVFTMWLTLYQMANADQRHGEVMQAIELHCGGGPSSRRL